MILTFRKKYEPEKEEEKAEMPLPYKIINGYYEFEVLFGKSGYTGISRQLYNKMKEDGWDMSVVPEKFIVDGVDNGILPRSS